MDIMQNSKDNREEETVAENQETNDLSLEEMFAELDGILEAMDDSEISLEDAFLLYEKGMEKIRRCNKKMDLVEKRMLVISREGSEEPFE